jgi:hypothetical protein
MNIMKRLIVTVSVAMISAPAFAAPIPVRVPEPGSIVFFAAGGIGAFGVYAIMKLTTRK